MRTCTLTVALLAGSAFVSGCGGSSNTPSQDAVARALGAVLPNGTPIDLTATIFSDSFEGSGESPNSCINQIPNWLAFPQKSTYGAHIFSDAVVGPAADGQHALYFFGAPTKKSQDLYLVSKPFSIAGLDSLNVSFSYLILGLNDAPTGGTGPTGSHGQDCHKDLSNTPGHGPVTAAAAPTPEPAEYLRLEACNGSAEECLDNSAWTQLFQHDPALNGNSLNGKNHTLADWVPASIDVPLAQLDASKPVFFRFHVKLSEGLASGAVFTSISDENNCCKVPTKHLSFLDGAAIDKIAITGTVTCQGGEGPCEPGPGPDPSPSPSVSVTPSPEPSPSPSPSPDDGGGEGPPGEFPPPS